MATIMFWGKWLAKLKSPMFRDTVWTFVGQIGFLLIQASYFVIIARSLGPTAFGAMVSTSAMALILMPFVSFGTGSLLLKNVARDRRTFPERFGNALFMTLVTGILFTAVDMFLSRWTLPSAFTWHFIFVIFISDIIAFRFIEICRQAYQAVNRMAMTAAIQIIGTAGRLIAALVMLKFWPHPTAAIWANFYCVSSWMTAVLAVAMVCKGVGLPRLRLSLIWPEIPEGLYFSIGYSATTIYNDIDKTMVGRLSTLDAAGLYGAAYRILEVGFVPLRSLLLTTLPRFFNTGKHGLQETIGFARKLLKPGLIYAAGATLGLIVVAPYLPYVLGPAYANSVEALRWLSPILIMRVIHLTLGDAITGADRQGMRTVFQVSAAIVNVLINFWIIPRYSWRGAAWSSLICDASLAITFGVYVFVATRIYASKQATYAA